MKNRLYRICDIDSNDDDGGSDCDSDGRVCVHADGCVCLGLGLGLYWYLHFPRFQFCGEYCNFFQDYILN